MAVETPHGLFIHIPKSGGRWVSETMVALVPGAQWVDDKTNDAHAMPQRDKQAFVFVRHPVSWMSSLWHHRARKNFNWHVQNTRGQPAVELEVRCGNNDFRGFMENIAARPGVVTEYVQHWASHYSDPLFGRMEHIALDLCSILNTIGDDIDCREVYARGRIKRGSALKPNKCPKELQQQIRDNERDFFSVFYTASEYDVLV